MTISSLQRIDQHMLSAALTPWDLSAKSMMRTRNNVHTVTSGCTEWRYPSRLSFCENQTAATIHSVAVFQVCRIQEHQWSPSLPLTNKGFENIDEW
ncbi:hypothetical protein E4U54_007418 [Claviceps lovelessii]|nr:hypothetical protein E4U54_007418 [Claviceps lovelessii]